MERKRRKTALAAAALAAAWIVAGCSVLNPYRGDFECPQMEKGKCVAVETAYRESLERKRLDPAGAQGKGDGASGAEEAWRKEAYAALAGMLQKPKAPLVAPPKVMRVLLLPYRADDGELYMARYAYFIVDEARFVLGERVTPEALGTAGEE